MRYRNIVDEVIRMVVFDVKEDVKRHTYNTQCFDGPDDLQEAINTKQFLIDLHNDGQYYFFIDELKDWVEQMAYYVEYFHYMPHQDVFLVIGRFDYVESN